MWKFSEGKHYIQNVIAEIGRVEIYYTHNSACMGNFHINSIGEYQGYDISIIPDDALTEYTIMDTAAYASTILANCGGYDAQSYVDPQSKKIVIIQYCNYFEKPKTPDPSKTPDPPKTPEKPTQKTVVKEQEKKCNFKSGFQRWLFGQLRFLTAATAWFVICIVLPVGMSFYASYLGLLILYSISGMLTFLWFMFLLYEILSVLEDIRDKNKPQ
jgi:hypothetical protein